MNKVFLMGRLTADPEFSMTQSGMAMCRFSIAVDRPARQGEEKQADFFRVVCWQQTAETVNRYFVKGKPIIVEGRIQNNNYTDNNGVKHYGTDIVADRINFVLSDPTRNGNNGGGYSNNNGYQNNNYNNGGYNNNNGYQNNNYNNGGYNNGGVVITITATITAVIRISRIITMLRPSSLLRPYRKTSRKTFSSAMTAEKAMTSTILKKSSVTAHCRSDSSLFFRKELKQYYGT